MYSSLLRRSVFDTADRHWLRFFPHEYLEARIVEFKIGRIVSHGKDLLTGWRFWTHFADPLHLGFGCVLWIHPAVRAHLPTISFPQNRSLDAFYHDCISTVLAFEFNRARLRVFGAEQRPPLQDVCFVVAVNRE